MAKNIIALSYLIISACAVPLHNECSITSGWNEDMKEPIKEDVPYCLIDNCVIRRMDTSQELKIIDVENDALVTLAEDNRTSVIITLLPNEENCQEANDATDDVPSAETKILLAMKAALLVLAIILSVYIIIVYSLWDKLQSSLGKLFVIHNSLLAADKLILLILLVFHTIMNATAPFCQLVIYANLYLKLSYSISASIILMHIAYLLYQSRYQHYELSASWKKNLMKFYTLAIFTSMIPMMGFIILFDIFSGAGKDTVSSNGHCIFPLVTGYNTFTHLYGYCVPWKLVQLVTFILIVVHYKNLYDTLEGNAADTLSVVGEPKVPLLFGLAIVMAISVLCSTILYFIVFTFLTHLYTVSLCLNMLTILIEIAQEFIIAVKLTVLLKTKGLPKQFPA